MTMDRVLLLDTNVASAPIHQFLVAAGFEVHVVGRNPQDFLAKAVSNYVELDYSDVDAAEALIDRLGARFLVPGCNDLSYETCAQISARRRAATLSSAVGAGRAARRRQGIRPAPALIRPPRPLRAETAHAPRRPPVHGPALPMPTTSRVRPTFVAAGTWAVARRSRSSSWASGGSSRRRARSASCSGAPSMSSSRSAKRQRRSLRPPAPRRHRRGATPHASRKPSTPRPWSAIIWRVCVDVRCAGGPA